MQLSVGRTYRLVLFLVAYVLISCTAWQSRATDNFWTGGFNNSWNNVNNWKFMGLITPIPRVPSDIDNAILTSPASDDVTLFGNTAPINGLTLGNSISLITNGFLLQVDDAGAAEAAIESGGSLFVTERVGGPAFLTDSLSIRDSGRLLIGGGNTVVEGSTTLSSNGSIINNGVGGPPLFFPFSFPGDVQFQGDVSLSDATIDIDFTATTSFSPGLTVRAEDASFIDLGRTLDIVDGITFNLLSGSLLRTPEIRIGTDGQGNGSVGTLVVDGSMSRVTSAGFSTNAPLMIGHGIMGSGLVQVANGGIYDTSTATTIVEATGTLEISGGTFNANGHIQVDGGTISIDGGGNALVLANGKHATVTNGGQFRVIAGSHVIKNDSTYEINGGSSLEVDHVLGLGAIDQAGTLIVDGAGSSVTSGDRLSIGWANGASLAALRNGATGSVSGLEIGQLSANGVQGTLSVETGGTLDVTGDVLLASLGGPVSGFGNIVVNSAGHIQHMGTGTTTIGSGSGRTGSITVSGGGTYSTSSGALQIGATGTVDVQGGATRGLFVANGATTVSGVMHIRAASGQPDDPGGELHSNALMTIDAGTINLSTGVLSANSIAVANGGALNFIGGELRVGIYNADLVNQGGTLAPGESAGATTIIGNYTQLGTGRLEIEIGGIGMGTEHDFVNITGSAIVDGDIELALIDGFVPNLTDAFTVLNTASLLGIFDNIANGGRLDTSDGGGSFQVNYGLASAFNPNQIVLSNFRSATADRDNDGDVDGNDFLLIQRTVPSIIPLWESQFGSGNSSASGVAVPEPGCLVMLLGTLTWIFRLRPLTLRNALP